MAENEDLDLQELDAGAIPPDANNAPPEQPTEEQAEDEPAADQPTDEDVSDEESDKKNLQVDKNPVSRVHELEAVYDIPVEVSAVLGKSTMKVSQLLKLGRGAVVELDRKVGEAIDIYVNNRLVARGEVVVVEDRLGVTMTEIVKTERR